MTYEPPRHVLLRKHTAAVSDLDMVCLERVLQRQLADVARYYELAPPGVSYVCNDTVLPSGEAVGIDFVDNDGLEGATAHHGWSEAAKYPWSLVGVKETWSWTMAASHEAIEMFLNLRLDRWADGPALSRWPMEACDPVESDGYPMGVEIRGTIRDVRVSNYVLPSFWHPFGTWPYDYLGVLEAPFTVAPGGYALVERPGQDFASLGDSTRSRARLHSRVARLSSNRAG